MTEGDFELNLANQILAKIAFWRIIMNPKIESSTYQELEHECGNVMEYNTNLQKLKSWNLLTNNVVFTLLCSIVSF